MRSVLFAVAGYALEKLFSLLCRLHANTKNLHFPFDITFGFVNKGRHLGPAPGSPAATVEKNHGGGRLRKYGGKINGRTLNIMQLSPGKIIVHFAFVHCRSFSP